MLINHKQLVMFSVCGFFFNNVISVFLIACSLTAGYLLRKSTYTQMSAQMNTLDDMKILIAKV